MVRSVRVSAAGSPAERRSNEGGNEVTNGKDCPECLGSVEDLYPTAPRDAAREWFRKARFGLFIHYANLLMNTGLRADGSIHPADDSALREAGERMRSSSSHL
jgi:hypothetical protein